MAASAIEGDASGPVGRDRLGGHGDAPPFAGAVAVGGAVTIDVAGGIRLGAREVPEAVDVVELVGDGAVAANRLDVALNAAEVGSQESGVVDVAAMSARERIAG